MQYKNTFTLKTNRFLFLFFLMFIIFIFSTIADVEAKSPWAAKRFPVQWTPKKIIEVVTPSQMVEKPLTFRINHLYRFPIKYDIKFKVSSDLQPFIRITPKSIKNILPNQEYSAQLTISIPSDTPEGDYKGSIKMSVKTHRRGKRWKKWRASTKLKTHIHVTAQAMDLSVKNANNYPTRITTDPGQDFYVTDAFAGSVFIYNTDLGLIKELKGFDSPLGIAVAPSGNIYVGNNGRDNIEVYNADGVLQSTIDDGNILMPNDLALDLKDNLYVVDSQADVIKVYNSSGQWLHDLGGAGDSAGNLNFPTAIAIAHTPYDQDETALIYIADQGHAKVQVYDISGNFITSFGEKIAAFSSDWEGKFSKIQGLAFDDLGQLHVLDCYLNKIQILNPDVALAQDADRFIDAYGEAGTNRGQLNLPMDIFITESGNTVVTNAGNQKIEKINITP